MVDRRNDTTASLPGDDRPFLPNLRFEQRLQGLVLIRFAVAIAIVPAALFASGVLGVADLGVRALCILAAVLFLCNVVTFLIIRPYRHDRGRAEAAQAFLEWILHFTVAIDFVSLTVALWLLGGAFSPFKAFFIFNVIIASVLLSRRAAFAHALFAYLLLAGLIIATWQGWIPAHYPRGIVAGEITLGGVFVLTVLLVQGLLILLTVWLTTHFMGLLRKRARQLIDSNRELDRLSQLRRDFLHIALHNLRAPISAVSMHISNIAEGFGGALTEPQKEWIERSQHRLKELHRFLHDLEYLTALEIGDLKQHTEIVDIGEIVEALVEENLDLVAEAEHTLTLEKADGLAKVEGIPRLIKEALANYVTNAIKYTPKGGRIGIRVLNDEGLVRVEVKDDGIGIAEEDQDRLFRELIRIRNEDTPLGQVAGSGLGLFIVKQIADMHGAHIEVKSRLGKGSTFFIAFPAV